MIDESRLNNYFLPLCLDLIRNEQSFRENFLKIASSIYAEIISYTENPNCSCRNTIIKFINTNKESIISCIRSWDEINNKLNNNDLDLKYKLSNIAGRVFYINKTEKDYSDFLKTIKNNKYYYKGFNIVPEGEKWAVLFY